MKGIYLFLFFIVFSTASFAQRSADLQLLPSYIGVSNDSKHLLSPGEKILFSGNGNSQYWFTWRIKNLGPDMLSEADTIVIKTGFDTAVYYVFPAGKTLKKDSTISIVPTDMAGFQVPVTLKPATTVAQSGSDTVYQWCDSIYAVAGPSNPALTDPSQANNVSCDTVEVTYWLTGIGDIAVQNDGLIIYPNPSSGTLNIEYDFGTQAPGKISIMFRDVTGNIVYQSALENQMPGKRKYSINTGDLPQGVYLAELIFEEKKVSRVITVN